MSGREVTIICDQCLKRAHVEPIQGEAYKDWVYVECHGVSRLAHIWFSPLEGRGNQIHLLWSQVKHWYGPDNAGKEIARLEADIADARRAIEFWKRVR